VRLIDCEEIRRLEGQPKCSFCGKAKSDTLAMAEGISGYICDACVSRAKKIIGGKGL
jgi:Zn finger protein HypA/HybF involved in hydrogenase expression